MGENGSIKSAVVTDECIGGKFMLYFVEEKPGLAPVVLESSFSNPFTNYIAWPDMYFELHSVIADLPLNPQLSIGAQRGKVARTGN